MDNLQKPLQVFDKGKPQMPSCSEATIEKWSVEELCSWLKELGIPENSLQEAENEEISGSSFLSFRKSGELRDCLKLKIGPWIVLENELSLHLERSGDISGQVLTPPNGQTVVKNNCILETEVVEESAEPETMNNPSIKTFREIPSKINLSEEEKKLSLLRNALHLDIESQTEYKNHLSLIHI